MRLFPIRGAHLVNEAAFVRFANEARLDKLFDSHAGTKVKSENLTRPYSKNRKPEAASGGAEPGIVRQ